MLRRQLPRVQGVIPRVLDFPQVGNGEDRFQASLDPPVFQAIKRT